MSEREVTQVEPELRAVLDDSRRLGFLGPAPIDEVIDHARAFTRALTDVTGAVVDLGSGGGIPGLVVAHDRPELSVTLVDRRQKRTDALERAVRRLGWSDRVEVRHADVEDLEPARWDVAIARGFGPPETTVRLAHAVVRPGGLIVISEPPSGDRWSALDVEGALVDRRPVDDGRVVSFTRRP